MWNMTTTTVPSALKSPGAIAVYKAVFNADEATAGLYLDMLVKRFCPPPAFFLNQMKLFQRLVACASLRIFDLSTFNALEVWITIFT